MNPRPWLRLHSEPLLTHRPWLAVRRDHVRLPTGAELTDYYVLEYPDWVNVLAFTEAGQTVLVRQWRHAFGGPSLELPGGAADPEDSNLEASARRELLEETGYGGGEWKHLLSSSPNPATHTNRIHTFVATGVVRQQQPHPDAGEDLVVCQLPLAELRSCIERGEIVQAMHMAPILYYLLSQRSSS